jgi:hypothetical protein
MDFPETMERAICTFAVAKKTEQKTELVTKKMEGTQI